ncbi:MAG TPA: hypothetical protein VGF08_06395 [Terriglobales bacterium]
MECAKLKLLDGALAATHFLCNFAQTPLIHEPPENNLALVGRKSINQLKEDCPLLDAVICASRFQDFGRYFLPSSRMLPSVR